MMDGFEEYRRCMTERALADLNDHLILQWPYRRAIGIWLPDECDRLSGWILSADPDTLVEV